MMVFENRVLGRVFYPKREKVMEGWRKLQYEKLHLCPIHYILLECSNQGRWVGQEARMEEKRNA
jgi:hypothetical protein